MRRCCPDGTPEYVEFVPRLTRWKRRKGTQPVLCAQFSGTRDCQRRVFRHIETAWVELPNFKSPHFVQTAKNLESGLPAPQVLDLGRLKSGSGSAQRFAHRFFGRVDDNIRLVLA